MKPEAGRCPCCGELTLNYDEGPDHDGEYMYYTWTCTNCDSSGTEAYSVTFLQHDIRTTGDRNKYQVHDS